MENRIQPINKTRLISDKDSPLNNIWRPLVKSPSVPPTPERRRAEISALLEAGEGGVVCIHTSGIHDRDIIKRLSELAEKKTRIYILVNEYSQELDPLVGKSLIREGVRAFGSILLVNPNSKQPCGAFFSGALKEDDFRVREHFLHAVDANSAGKASSLFRHFCFLFWEKAKNERLEKGNSTPITTKPLDVFHDPDVFEKRDFVFGTLFDFVKETQRGEVSGELIVPLNRERERPIEMKKFDTVTLPENKHSSLMSRSEFEASEPKEFPDDGFVVERTYEWKNVPFFLPSGATDAPLYGEWDREHEKISKFIGAMNGLLDNTIGRKNKLPTALSRFFLGKETRFAALKEELREIWKADFRNLDAQVLKEKIGRINRIRMEIETDIGEIDCGEKKARLDEEIEKLNAKIGKQKEEVEKLKTTLVEKEAEKAKSETLSTEQDSSQDPFFISKTKSELERAEGELRRLEGEKANKSKEKDRVVPQRAQSESSLNEVIVNEKRDTSTRKPLPTLTVPALSQLPQAGKLYRVNGSDFLAIENWSEFDLGQKEAKRLNAKLCAVTINKQ